MSPVRTVRIAAFVSPHGFGHAARACAVLEALAEIARGGSAEPGAPRGSRASRGSRRSDTGLEVDLYTTVPAWFFTESLRLPFTRHELACDLGLVQRSALDEDPAATARALADFWPPSPKLLARLAAELSARSTRLVLCDMSALGLAVARRAALPSVVVESFEWRWIYDAYRDDEPRLAAFGERFTEELASATRRFRAEPFCGEAPGTAVGPISRRPRSDRATVRTRLGVREGQPLVLVTMGGFPWSFAPESLRIGTGGGEVGDSRARPLYVVPGGAEQERREGDLVLLPHHSPIHHPDLVAAADVVVGKLGYSTVVESARAGARFAYLPRPRFPESPVLAAWLGARMPTLELTPQAFGDGSWARRLPELLARPAGRPTAADGAESVARALFDLLA